MKLNISIKGSNNPRENDQKITLESLLTTLLTQSHKLHLEQLRDYPLFVQVEIEYLILSNLNSSVILSFSHNP